jgi:hypothetical protein
MADSLTFKADLQMTGKQIKDLDLGDPVFNLAQQFQKNFASGTGAGQVDRLFTDERTLGDGANESLDLAGSLVDAFGAVITFAKIKFLAIKNKSATQTLTVGGAAATTWTGPFGASTHTLAIPPDAEGSAFIVLVANAAGIAVGAGTADLLKILNSAGATCAYDIIIVGTSA